MNKKCIILLSALVALTGTSCWGVARVYWENSDRAVDYPVGTSVGAVKKSYLRLFGSYLLKVTVTGVPGADDNYLLKDGDVATIGLITPL